MDRSRVMIVLAFLLVPLGGLEARLVHLQLLSSSDAASELSNRRQSVEIVHPPRGRILDVNYEDLVREPEAQARRVMAFCGLAYVPSQIRVESYAAPVSTASSSQVRQPIHTRNIGGWRSYAEPLAPLQALLDAAGHATAAAG